MTTYRTITTDPHELEGFHDCACRIVTIDYDGESWWSYWILDRKKLCQRIQRHRQEGYSYSFIGRSQMFAPEMAYHYGGPGRAFSDVGFRRRTTSRRFVVYVQRGGLDI